MSRTSDTLEESGDPELKRLQHGIQRTRADMSATISELETRLSPAEVREKVGAELQHVEERVRVVVREQLDEAKTVVQAELREAKQLLRDEMNEAEAKIKQGLGQARDTVKKDLEDALTGAKKAIRANTLGKVEDLATSIGDKMNDTRDTLVDTIRNNPIPAAITGFGLVWLLMNRSKSASGGGNGRPGQLYQPHGDFLSGARGAVGQVAGRIEGAVGQAGSAVGKAAHQITDAASHGLHQASDAAGSALHSASDAAGNALHSAAETAGEFAHKAGDAASHLAEQAGDAAKSVADGARKGAQRVEQGFQTALKDNPMAVGAAAVAIGAAVGFALPRTQGEDAVMGKTRDRLLGRASDVAHDAAASAAELAEHTLEGAKKSFQGDAASSSR